LDLYDAVDTARWRGAGREMGAIAAHAERSRRPIAASVGLEPELREALGHDWWFRGLVFVRRQPAQTGTSTAIDVAGVDSTAATIRGLFAGRVDPRRVDDPAGAYLISLLTCPTLAKEALQRTPEDSTGLLASRCNFR
jgi:hypothetical protein